MRTLYIFFILVLFFLLLLTQCPNSEPLQENYYNTPSNTCQNCNSYNNYLSLNDTCYLKHLYDQKETNTLASIYDNDRFCRLGYYDV